LVEGFFDCMKVYQAGARAVVALMGAALYPSQQRALLERFRRVILMLDGDSAGQRATAAITARLRTHCALRVIHLPAQTHPDLLSDEEIRHILEIDVNGQAWHDPALGRAC
jgi:DNA primase